MGAFPAARCSQVDGVDAIVAQHRKLLEGEFPSRVDNASRIGMNAPGTAADVAGACTAPCRAE
jgi:hypothetical protein